MISTFFDHELKAFWRSKNTGKSIAVKVFMGIIILYFLVIACIFGFTLDESLAKIFPHDPLITVFCGLVLVYFIFDMLMRLQLQELPTLKVQPYLQLPIRRNTIISYLALTAVFSFFNLWPLVLFGPFIFKIIAAANGVLTAVAFIISLLALSVFNNYLALYIKRKANLNGWVLLIAGAAFALLIAGDFVWHLYSIKAISYLYFGHLITMPYLVIIPLVLAVGMYYLNFYYLKSNLYLEELTSKKNTPHRSSTEIPFLNRFGSVGDLAANEIKLIIRNKRSKSTLVAGLIFMFYGLLFYNNPKLGESFKVFVGMFMTGIFIINYGQFMYSWQASHFDGLMVSKLKFSDFLKGKYLLFTIVSTVAFILTTPYVYYGWRTVMVHFVMYLWNLGVNTTIVLFFANRNYKRIDLSKGASFNWEGVGSTQLLLSFPLLLLPYLIFVPVKLLVNTDVALGILAAIGIAGILTRDFWIKKLEADFQTKRFKIAEGFRNK